MKNSQYGLMSNDLRGRTVKSAECDAGHHIARQSVDDGTNRILCSVMIFMVRLACKVRQSLFSRSEAEKRHTSGMIGQVQISGWLVAEVGRRARQC
jgi:hypothetical protein